MPQTPSGMAIGIGILVLLERFISQSLSGTHWPCSSWISRHPGAFRAVVGFVNVLTVHERKNRARRPGWPYSLSWSVFHSSVFVIGGLAIAPLLHQVLGPSNIRCKVSVASC